MAHRLQNTKILGRAEKMSRYSLSCGVDNLVHGVGHECETHVVQVLKLGKWGFTSIKPRKEGMGDRGRFSR